VPYSKLTVGVPRELKSLERRVGLSPNAAKLLIDRGIQVLIETDAGAFADFANRAYEEVIQ
jgi:alanine dehydrogenase